MGDDEEQPEEDGQPAAPEIVRDRRDGSDAARGRRGRGRTAARTSVLLGRPERSGPGEGGGSLLRETLRLLRRSPPMSTAVCCSSASSASCCSRRCRARLLEQLLRHRDGERGQRRPRRRRTRPTRCCELLRRDHLGDEPPCERLIGTEPPIRAHPLEGPARSRAVAPETSVPPASGTRPMPTKPGTNAAVLEAIRTSQALASDSPAPAAAPVDGRDHGLREPTDQPDVRVVGLLERVTQRSLRALRTPAGPGRRRTHGPHP